MLRAHVRSDHAQRRQHLPEPLPIASLLGLHQDVEPERRLAAPPGRVKRRLVSAERALAHRPRDILARGKAVGVSALEVPPGQRAIGLQLDLSGDRLRKRYEGRHQLAVDQQLGRRGGQVCHRTSPMVELVVGVVDLEHVDRAGVHLDRTGVEMEALTAVSVAALTIYDMCKAIDRGMTIGTIRLLAKSGGRSGDWRAES